MAYRQRQSDIKLKDQFGSPKHFDISDSEKKAIIEFLKTLTDYDS